MPKVLFLFFLLSLVGCASSPNPRGAEISNDIGLQRIVLADTRIVGDCNIVVNVTNSEKVNLTNSTQCADPKNKTAMDIDYCNRESQRKYSTIYPGGLLTLPLAPIFGIINYVDRKNAESDANHDYTSCMETRGHIMNGYGAYTFENGNKYQGNWKDGAFDGEGIFYWKDGGSYDGQWSNSQKNGDGFDIYSDGATYKGKFENNVRSGHGVMTWPDGRRFEGSFHNDRPNGPGIFTESNGERYDGLWSNGCFKDGNRWAVINQNQLYCQ